MWAGLGRAGRCFWYTVPANISGCERTTTRSGHYGRAPVGLVGCCTRHHLAAFVPHAEQPSFHTRSCLQKRRAGRSGRREWEAALAPRTPREAELRCSPCAKHVASPCSGSPVATKCEVSCCTAKQGLGSKHLFFADSNSWQRASRVLSAGPCEGHKFSGLFDHPCSLLSTAHRHAPHIQWRQTVMRTSS